MKSYQKSAKFLMIPPRLTAFFACGMAGVRFLSNSMRMKEVNMSAGTIPNNAALFPGHSIPLPSAPQKIPKAVVIMPTMYFKVFSGTRDKGL
jgi:hypothetical protein